MRWLRFVPALFLVALIGCPQSAPPVKDGKQTAKSKQVLGISVLTLTNPFFKVIADEFTAEANKHGYDVIAVAGELDVAKQQNQVKDFIVRKTAAIVLCPCDSRAIGPVIQEANKAGIPVFTADIACLAPDAKVVSHIATDNYEGGRQAAQGMIEALDKLGGKIAVLDYAQVESCQQRTKGFREVLDEHNKKHPSATIEIVKTLPCDGNRERGYKAAQDALQAHPDLAGIFAINDPSALGAWAAVNDSKRSTRTVIIGFDGQPDGRKAIREGKIYADPIQYPDKIGREAFHAIRKYFEGEKVASEILIPPALYRQANAKEDPLAK